MKKLIILAGLIFIGACAWRFGERTDPEALNMAVGILLGILAGLPTALLVLASGQRSSDYVRPQRSFEPSHDQEVQRELQALRRENIRLQAALDARQLPRPTEARLRVVGEWEE